MAGAKTDGRRFLLHGRSSCGASRVERMVTREEGERNVLLGKWHRKHDSYSGELIGYQVGLSVADERGDYELPSVVTTAAISAREMEVNAGVAGDPSSERSQRTRAKVRVYVHLTAARGDILRVWPARWGSE